MTLERLAEEDDFVLKNAEKTLYQFCEGSGTYLEDDELVVTGDKTLIPDGSFVAVYELVGFKRKQVNTIHTLK